jgi:hypothetical protein
MLLVLGLPVLVLVLPWFEVSADIDDIDRRPTKLCEPWGAAPFGFGYERGYGCACPLELEEVEATLSLRDLDIIGTDDSEGIEGLGFNENKDEARDDTDPFFRSEGDLTDADADVAVAIKVVDFARDKVGEGRMAVVELDGGDNRAEWGTLCFALALRTALSSSSSKALMTLIASSSRSAIARLISAVVNRPPSSNMSCADRALDRFVALEDDLDCKLLLLLDWDELVVRVDRLGLVGGESRCGFGASELFLEEDLDAVGDVDLSGDVALRMKDAIILFPGFLKCIVDAVGFAGLLAAAVDTLEEYRSNAFCRNIRYSSSLVLSQFRFTEDRM